MHPSFHPYSLRQYFPSFCINVYWNADQTTVAKDVFLQRLVSVMAEDEWIIDGNYASTMELRLAACDTVIFLDYPLEICLNGIRERRGTPRDDMPWVETEEDETFVAFVKDYGRCQRPEVLSLLSSYGEGKNVMIFQSRAEAEAFLLRI